MQTKEKPLFQVMVKGGMMFKQLIRTKLGTIFLCLLAVAATIFLLNISYGTSKFSQWKRLSDERHGIAAWMRLKRLQGVKPVGVGWGVFINKGTQTAYCKFPDISLKHAGDLGLLYEKLAPLDCSNRTSQYSEIFFLQRGFVKLEPTKASLLDRFEECNFINIVRHSDDLYTEPVAHRVKRGKFKTFRFRGDFLKVECFHSVATTAAVFNLSTVSMDYSNDDDSTEPDYEQYLLQIDPVQDVVKQQREILEEKEVSEHPTYNVALIGLDSLSHLSWQRNLPKTYKYIKEELDAIIMKGFNIVGDGTSPQFLAMFTGKYQEELPEVRKMKVTSRFLDELPWMWYRYERAGYVTMLAEDEPTLSSFNLRFLGFEEQPTNHYMRSFWLSAWASQLNKDSRRFCLGNRPKLNFHLKYLNDLYVKYPRLPKFSLLWHGELTHANNNPGQYGDANLRKFLQNWKENGILKKTFLVVLSDHGARNRQNREHVQGRLEERLPLLAIIPPTSFRSNYPLAISNLKANRERLVTPFDMHATLLDLLNWKYPENTESLAWNKQAERGANPHRSISLFRPIPSNRTCSSADVPLHFCSCMTWQPAPSTDQHVTASANRLKEFINGLTEPFRELCVPIKSLKVKDARVVLPNERVLHYYNSLDDDHLVANFSSDAMKLDAVYYQLNVLALPSKERFEATVLVKAKHSSYEVLGGISRLDRYNDKPKCILKKDPELRQFCTCRS